jgi:hypothetical protein
MRNPRSSICGAECSFTVNISSRTPEGEPNRCPVCGNVLAIEPSRPPGDAPCPYCGTFLWFPVSRLEAVPMQLEWHVPVSMPEPTGQACEETVATVGADASKSTHTGTVLAPVMAVLRAILLFGVLMACMLGGIFAACGLCTYIYGPAILETALGNPPDRTHPAFWLSLVLMVPAMLIGAAGAIFAVILPVSARWRVPGFLTSPADRRFLRWYFRFVSRSFRR